MDPKMAYDLAAIFAHDKMDKLAQSKRGQAITGNVLTAGVVIIALLIVFSALTDRRGERFRRYHDPQLNQRCNCTHFR
jgi:hypothetical protein